MKLYLFPTFLIVFWVSLDAADAQTRPPPAPESAKVDKVIGYIRKGGTLLREALHTMRADVDKKLIELFPELKEKILQLHGDIDQCYDQTISKNVQINIFNSTVKVVIKKFFKSNGHLLENLKLPEVQKRIKAFMKNLGKLVELLVVCVVKKSTGKPASRLGLTSMAAFTEKEMEKLVLNKNIRKNEFLRDRDNHNDRTSTITDCSRKPTFPGEEDMHIPDEFNWNDMGFVSPVYHQGGCGSCYVFATTSALESQYMIRNLTLEPPQFSIQATLNCMEGGCGGGGLREPMSFLVTKGVPLAKEMPYVDGALKCNKDYKVALKADHYCYLEKLDEVTMQRLIIRNGPAAVAIDAKASELVFLKGSPFEGECGRQLDHAVLMVGWNKKYWIIKNSWGTKWGIDGFLYLPKGGNNTNKCGIQEMLGVPIVF